MAPIGRAFVAVVPPDPVLDALVECVTVAGRHHPGLRWVRREQLHVTLQFLGRVDDADGLTAALARAAASVPAFEVRLGGTGAFPKPRRASVVWVGAVVGASDLTELARAVCGATATLGFEAEERPFHPHVTVARLRRPQPVDGLLSNLGDQPVGPAFALREVVLLQSHTRGEGAVYEEVARLPLKA
jgi:2'-5' RNA ligase